MRVVINKHGPQKSRRPSRCSGGIAVEFAFVAPILFTLMAGAFEISRIIFNYQVVLSAVYEGARAGSQIDPAALGSGCFGTTALQYESAPSSSPERMVMERVTYLLGLQGSGLSLESPRISAEIVKSGNGQTLSSAQACSSLEKENTFAIRMVGTYRPAIFSFLAIPITVESRAYLLANNKTFSTKINPNPNGSCGGLSSGTYKESPSPEFSLLPGGGEMQIAKAPNQGLSGREAAIIDLCNSSPVVSEVTAPFD